MELCDKADCTTGKWTTGSLETRVVSRGHDRMTDEAGILTGTWIRETVCNEAAEEAIAGISETEVGTAASDVWIPGAEVGTGGPGTGGGSCTGAGGG